MKTLLVLTSGYNRRDSAELERLEQEDQIPRATLLEKRLNADLLYDRYPDATPVWRRRLYRLLPRNVPQALEAFILRNRYDAIITWSERITLPLALLLKLTGSKTPHLAIFSSITKPKKALFLRAVKSHVNRYAIGSEDQRAFAIARVGVAPTRIIPITWMVDQQFWRPIPGPMDQISTSGREMRDYGTLVRALRDVPIRCHIAARLIPWKKDAWISELASMKPLPAHITLGNNETLLQVREHYARSAFVVLPLLPTDYDVGSTVILEAMAMGKALICTRLPAQREIVQDGKTGILVPPGDPEALRQAIIFLWEHPDVAAEMGREARRQIEQKYGFDDWVDRIVRAVEDSIQEKQQARIGCTPRRRDNSG